MSNFRPPSVGVVDIPEPYINRKFANRSRLKIFSVVLGTSLIIGMIFVFGREPVYRSTASVLTVKPKAVDSESLEADTEHVAIQARLLLSEGLLSAIAENLRQNNNIEASISDLKETLKTVAVPDTNLLELQAQGSDPQTLQFMLSTWLDGYEQFRLQEVSKLTSTTELELRARQDDLQDEIISARGRLKDFREKYAIVSGDRDENRNLSAIRGLNKSINASQEKEIAAVAKLNSIKTAISAGEDVVPKESKAEIARMKLDVAHLQDKLRALREQFTDAYIERDPNLATLPEMLKDLERDLKLALDLGRNTVESEAKQQVDAARRTTLELKNELKRREAEAQEFTQHFKAFGLLEKELEELETLYAENETRIAKILLVDNEKFPPLKIIEDATLPIEPIYPLYARDAGIVAATSLIVALFVTWLREFLSSEQSDYSSGPNVGIQILSQPDAQLSQTENVVQAISPPSRKLEHHLNSSEPSTIAVLPRRLEVFEINSLIEFIHFPARPSIYLLLSGISPLELELLNYGDLQEDTRSINIGGANQRAIHLSPGVWDKLQMDWQVADQNEGLPTLVNFDALLSEAAEAAGMSHPEIVNAMSLWHSFIMFLVEQGIDDESLRGRVGDLPPGILEKLQDVAIIKPSGYQLEFTHPSLQT